MKLLKHLHVVNKHKRLVFYNAIRLGIPLRGFLHDFSKYRFVEFLPSVKYFDGKKSPTIKERENIGFSYISVNHSNRNMHHYQAWIDYELDHFIIHAMDYKYALEYVCDTLAATRVYTGKKNYVKNCINYLGERIDKYLMHPHTKEFILRVLFIINDYGFKKAKKSVTKRLYYNLLIKYDININIMFSNFNLDILKIRK